jgi:hypothetical protein
MWYIRASRRIILSGWSVTIATFRGFSDDFKDILIMLHFACLRAFNLISLVNKEPRRVKYVHEFGNVRRWIINPVALPYQFPYFILGILPEAVFAAIRIAGFYSALIFAAACLPGRGAKRFRNPVH